MVGLGLGSALVDYDTTLSALVTQGAVTGLVVGLAQGIVILPRLGRVALVWPPSSARLGRRLGGHHRRRHRRRGAVHGVRLQRRHRRDRARPSCSRFVAQPPRSGRVMSRHVVFGTGQIGRLVVEQLVASGTRWSPSTGAARGRIPGATVVGGDATDPAFTTRVAAGADAVYFCLNAPNYDALGRGVPAVAARRAGRRRGRRCPARGPRQPLRVRADPAAATWSRRCRPGPTSNKAATRAAMTVELLDAHAAGRVEVAIGRASDYFGPGHDPLGARRDRLRHRPRRSRPPR